MRWLTIEVVSSFLDEAICIYLGKDEARLNTSVLIFQNILR